MNIFKSKRKSVTITEKDPTHKVLYLGNVHTAMMKGSGCVDKPVSIIWKNYQNSANVGKDMELTICAFGMKVKTKDMGVTEYRAHRITYCIAHPEYPKLFIWVYRHEGKRMKVDLRCHAVLCKSEAKAKVIAVQLHEKLTVALRDFMREKSQKQRARLMMQRTNSLPTHGNAMPLRRQMLSTAENFKPSVEKSSSAPKLNAISEDGEEEEVTFTGSCISGLTDSACAESNCACLASVEEVDELVGEEYVTRSDVGSDSSSHGSGDATVIPDPTGDKPGSLDDLEREGQIVHNLDLLRSRMIDIEIGNDIEALRNDNSVVLSMQNPDSDDADSGFSDQRDNT